MTPIQVFKGTYWWWIPCPPLDKHTLFLTESASSFSDHCKRQGHIIDKCYKLHGYPNSKQPFRPKGGRFANNAWNDAENQSEVARAATNTAGPDHSTTQSVTLPGLDVDQSKQLLQFLANLLTGKQSSQGSTHPGVSNAYMGGINADLLRPITSANTICCTCQLDGKIWIIDSGASDNMIFDKDLLHNIGTLKVPILISLPNGNKVRVIQSSDLRIGNNLVFTSCLICTISPVQYSFNQKTEWTIKMPCYLLRRPLCPTGPFSEEASENW